MEEEERENEDVDPPIIKNESITTDTNSVKNETIINVVEEEEQKLPTNNNNNNLDKKRKLLPADSLVEHNINKHQRQLSDYHNDNNKKKMFSMLCLYLLILFNAISTGLSLPNSFSNVINA